MPKMFHHPLSFRPKYIILITSYYKKGFLLIQQTRSILSPEMTQAGMHKQEKFASRLGFNESGTRLYEWKYFLAIMKHLTYQLQAMGTSASFIVLNSANGDAYVATLTQIVHQA